ncbi:serine/threonine-protein kinase [Streptomyces lushanensis]|uniref:serine/threonine-protein kinase n=1 Tax=Streptomyces lushanensis TaxID=1434255 RepID=UPI0008353641|nr:serine/threonine-protein kinase [Streptomyces lushanensis]
MQPLEAGEPPTIGPYRLLGRLGSGGMGRVYLARSAGGRTVAVKVVHPHFATDEEFRARFRREVEAARRVGTGPDGPRWSAPVLDADPEAAVPWVATAYVAGPSLTQAVAGHGRLPEDSVRALGAGLAEALTGVHALGLVHRDVKPSNVLLSLDGPRLIDFGIARATDGTASLTSTGVSVGSPGYMSPEQILGKGISGAADVFSLGAVLVYAATGESPFPGDSSAALLYKVVHEEPELSALRGDLRDLAARCLAKDPSARPAPEEVARVLAPGGAAGLVAAGWLPGPLVEEVSRAAVRLLDLEAAAPAGGVRSAGAESGGAPLGVFGPPMDPAADSSADPAREGSLPGQRASDGRLSVSLTTDAGTGTRPAPGGAGTGTGDSTDAGRRGRRVSCTVALSVAGVLAAALVGSAFLFDLLPGGGSTETSGGPPSHPSSGASTSRPPAGSSTGSTPATEDPYPSSDPASDAAEPVTEVPAAFIGTWKGPTTERGGATHGDATAVIGKGGKGDDVVRMTYTISVLGVDTECRSIGRFVSGTAGRLRVTERTDEDYAGTQGLCTGAEAGLTFTLKGDRTVLYESDEAAAGTPTGTLTKR